MLLLGGSGRLGSAFRRTASGRFRVASPGRIPAGGLDRLLDESAPDLVVNAAAMSSPGACARDLRGAFSANVHLPGSLAAACAGRGIPLVHVSTDLVYGGAIPPYSESSPCVPRSFYGWTKLLGDRAVVQAYPDALVLRTSVLFGQAGAARPTFSEELLAGGVRTVHVDAFRHHTPISWFSTVILEAWGKRVSGLLLAAGRHSLSRSAFASMLFEHLGAGGCPPEGYRPAGTPEDLSLDLGRFESLLGRAPDPFRSFVLEYPQDPVSSSDRNLPV